MQATNHRCQIGVVSNEDTRVSYLASSVLQLTNHLYINSLHGVASLDLFEKGLLFFNAGDYYQAHEDWEDLWRVTSKPLRIFYQGLIQAAVGLHHLHKGNHLGARGQLGKSISHLTSFPENPHSIDTQNLIEQLRSIRNDMQVRPVRIVRIK